MLSLLTFPLLLIATNPPSEWSALWNMRSFEIEHEYNSKPESTSKRWRKPSMVTRYTTPCFLETCNDIKDERWSPKRTWTDVGESVSNFIENIVFTGAFQQIRLLSRQPMSMISKKPLLNYYHYRLKIILWDGIALVRSLQSSIRVSSMVSSFCPVSFVQTAMLGLRTAAKFRFPYRKVE